MQSDSKDKQPIYSMTGFGEGKASKNDVTIETKIKTVNHSGLSIKVRGLKEKKLLQHKAEKMLKESFSRGRIEVQISTDKSNVIDLERLDSETISNSYHALLELTDDLGIDQQPSLGDLISLDLLQMDSPFINAWPILEESLKLAVQETQDSQKSEGADLKTDLLQYLRGLEEGVEKIRPKVPLTVARHKEKLASRINELLEKSTELDERRLEQEVATLADKSDVDEELSRIKTHLNSARDALRNGGILGKKLKFIGQELQREINTLGAKSKDGEIQTDVIDLKLILEKFKEQARNVA